MAIIETILPEQVSLSRSPVLVKIKSNLPASVDAIDYIKNRIDGSPVVGETYTIIFGEVNETFTVQTTADYSGNTLSVQGAMNLATYASRLAEELNRNPTIFRAFIVQSVEVTGTYFVQITPRYVTTDQLAIDNQCTNIDASIIDYDPPSDNPALLLLVETYDHNTEEYSAPIAHVFPLLSPTEYVSFDIQKDFDLRYALPSFSTIGLGGDYIETCTDNWTKYRIRWAEQEGRPPVTRGLDRNLLTEYYAVHGGNAFLLSYEAFWVWWRDNGRFSTSQNKTKTIAMDQPEWLYWIGRDNSTVLHIYITATHRSGTTSTHQRGSLSLDLGKMVYIKAGFTQLGLPEDMDDPIVEYTLVLRNGSNEVVSEEFNYILTGQYGGYIRYFLFGNSLGGCDTVRATGKFVTSLDINTQEASRVVDDAIIDSGRATDFHYNRKVRGVYEGSVGYQSAKQIAYLQDLMQSEEVWAIDMQNNRFTPILIDTGSVELLKDGNDLFTLRFRYKHAWEDKSLGVSDDGQRIILPPDQEEYITIRE